MNREQQIADTAARIDGLLDRLDSTMAALNALVERGKAAAADRPPDDREQERTTAQ